MDVTFRPDVERIRAQKGEPRSPDRLLAHYEIETGLAHRLAHSNRHERPALYAQAYDELFRSVSDHPQHRKKRQDNTRRLTGQAERLLGWLDAGSTYVEIGCGDAELTKLVATRVKRAIGIDVTPHLVGDTAPPAFEFLLTDGTTIDLPDATADLVFSNQVMEHLHVDDVSAQLADIVRVLKPGGRYVCCTPNRLSGPHDISVYFGYEPRGFHLREYDHRAIRRLFRSAGFGKIHALLIAKGRTLTLPVAPFVGAELLLQALPGPVRRSVTGRSALETLLGINVVGVK